MKVQMFSMEDAVDRLLEEPPILQIGRLNIEDVMSLCCGLFKVHFHYAVVEQFYNGGNGLMSHNTPKEPKIWEKLEKREFHIFCHHPHIEIWVLIRIVHFHRPLANLQSMINGATDEEIKELINRINTCQRNLLSLWVEESPIDRKMTQTLQRCQLHDLDIIMHLRRRTE